MQKVDEMFTVNQNSMDGMVESYVCVYITNY